MHPMKEYMESILGKPVKMQDLGSFLEHDKKVVERGSGNKPLGVWSDGGAGLRAVSGAALLGGVG